MLQGLGAALCAMNPWRQQGFLISAWWVLLWVVPQLPGDAQAGEVVALMSLLSFQPGHPRYFVLPGFLAVGVILWMIPQLPGDAQVGAPQFFCSPWIFGYWGSVVEVPQLPGGAQVGTPQIFFSPWIFGWGYSLDGPSALWGCSGWRSCGSDVPALSPILTPQIFCSPWIFGCWGSALRVPSAP